MRIKTKKDFETKGKTKDGRTCFYYNFPKGAYFIAKTEINDPPELLQRCFDITHNTKKAQKLWQNIIRFFQDHPYHKSVVVIE